jgi:hypothetical protein
MLVWGSRLRQGKKERSEWIKFPMIKFASFATAFEFQCGWWFARFRVILKVDLGILIGRRVLNGKSEIHYRRLEEVLENNSGNLSTSGGWSLGGFLSRSRVAESSDFDDECLGWSLKLFSLDSPFLSGNSRHKAYSSNISSLAVIVLTQLHWWPTNFMKNPHKLLLILMVKLHDMWISRWASRSCLKGNFHEVTFVGNCCNYKYDADVFMLMKMQIPWIRATKWFFNHSRLASFPKILLVFFLEFPKHQKMQHKSWITKHKLKLCSEYFHSFEVQLIGNDFMFNASWISDDNSYWLTKFQNVSISWSTSSVSNLSTSSLPQKARLKALH